MKLLLILDSVEYPLAPNPVLARRVAVCLAQRGARSRSSGTLGRRDPSPAVPGCRQFPLAFADEREMNRALEFGQSGGTPVPPAPGSPVPPPSAAIAAVRQLALKRPRRVTAARGEIERLDRLYHYDAAVAVAAPTRAASLWRALLRRAQGQLADGPLCSQPSYAPRRLGKRTRAGPIHGPHFCRAHRCRRFCSRRAAGRTRRQNAGGRLSRSCPSHGPKASPCPARSRCVFAGSLYPQLRTPHFALELFAALDLPDVELSFLGGGWQNYPACLLPPYYDILGDRLTVTGPVPPCRRPPPLPGPMCCSAWAMGSTIRSPASCLITSPPASPSCTWQSSKPIPVLLIWKNGLWPVLVQESEGVTPQVLARCAFLREKGRLRLPFAEAARLYPENTPEHAVSLFERAFAAPDPMPKSL